MKEERTRILKMVEEGMLTAEEAIVLLEELEKSSKLMEEKHEKLVTDLSTVVQFENKKKKRAHKISFSPQKNEFLILWIPQLSKLKN